MVSGIVIVLITAQVWLEQEKKGILFNNIPDVVPSYNQYNGVDSRSLDRCHCRMSQRVHDGEHASQADEWSAPGLVEEVNEALAEELATNTLS